MSTDTISRWARRFLLGSGLFLIASQVAAAADTPRQVEVVLGLQGFVLLTVFGKAYSLVPSYRVGFYGPLAGVWFGLVGVTLGAWFAIQGVSVPLSTAHLRVNVFGLLGMSIVGTVFQFYPPSVGRWPFAGDRLAVATIACLAVGVALSALGAPVSTPIERGGQGVATLGALGYVYLLGSSVSRAS